MISQNTLFLFVIVYLVQAAGIYFLCPLCISRTKVQLKYKKRKGSRNHREGVNVINADQVSAFPQTSWAGLSLLRSTVAGRWKLRTERKAITRIVTVHREKSGLCGAGRSRKVGAEGEMRGRTFRPRYIPRDREKGTPRPRGVTRATTRSPFPTRARNVYRGGGDRLRSADTRRRNGAARWHRHRCGLLRKLRHAEIARPATSPAVSLARTCIIRESRWKIVRAARQPRTFSIGWTRARYYERSGRRKRL